MKQLHTDFLRAGADVLQAFTFYATDGKLKTSGHTYKVKILKFSIEVDTLFYVCFSAHTCQIHLSIFQFVGLSSTHPPINP